MRTDRTSSPTRFRRRTVVSIATLGLLAGVVLVPSQEAGAASVTAHDPIGAISKVTAVTRGITMTGWAADPDARTSNVTVAALLDGKKTVTSVRTARVFTKATKKYHLGRTPGFSITARVPSGKHLLCLVVRNVRSGVDSLRKCVATPLGRGLTSRQRAAHNPIGKMTSAWANKKSVHYRGWATDRDYQNLPTRVVLYVDGRAAATVTTTADPLPRPAGAGYRSKFDILVPVQVVGTHVGCLWVVDVGLGSNTHLGCKAVDNRTPHGSSLAYTKAPSTNSKVLALAKKQKGKRYVWGATGPKTFDCSGLVMWTYKHYGIRTPRVSQDQVKSARLIPASHVRPGDLVFLHDTQGDVYHVGIYTKPGQMFAAIGRAYGVNYQTLWDPSSVTYGSFTHT